MAASPIVEHKFLNASRLLRRNHRTITTHLNKQNRGKSKQATSELHETQF
jgi:hypothetical protein